MKNTNILNHFSTLEDPRQSWKVLYPLPEILLVLLCGVIAGAEDFVEIELRASRIYLASQREVNQFSFRHSFRSLSLKLSV
jgi:hypothetical protein